MRPIFRSKSISSLLGAYLYKQTVLNILLFGCETWAPTKHQLDRLTRFHNDCDRLIYAITRWHHQHEHITMLEVLGVLLLDPLEETIEQRTLKLLAKTAQLPNDNLTRRIMFCQATPNGPPCHGAGPMYTKRRFFEVLSCNNFVRTGKDTNDKLDSMDVWKQKVVLWSKAGSKLERWHERRGVPLFATLDPVQDFGRSTSAKHVFSLLLQLTCTRTSHGCIRQPTGLLHSKPRTYRMNSARARVCVCVCVCVCVS
jgi:hypothetical protein